MAKEKKRINRLHKDRLFIRIFQDKGALLDLYNALNHTHYNNPDELTITTIEDALYIGMKNDISFLFGEELHLYEHQSTYNPNMPLRGLFYLCEVYQGMIASREENLFSSRMIQIPEPHYLIFYNGTEDDADQKEVLLSDAFLRKKSIKANLELRATIININLGHNKELMQQSKKLRDYAHLIHYIREAMELTHGDLEAAVNQAVNRCIEEEILADFLRKHRGEVYGLILLEYDEQAFLKSERKIWKEEGFQEGLQKSLAGIIQICKELHLSKQETYAKLQTQFQLSEEEIRHFLDVYWAD